MGPLKKRKQEDAGISAANAAVRDQIMGKQVYTGPKLDAGDLFSGKPKAIARNKAWFNGVKDPSNYKTEGGVDKLQKLDLNKGVTDPKYATGSESAAWAKGMAGGLGLPEPADTRKAMMNAAKGQINASTRDARVGDAQGMQASGMDDSGMALALGQQRTMQQGQSMANAAQATESDYANRLEGYRNQLMGAAQNYAGQSASFGLNKAAQQQGVNSAEYQQNVWDPYQMKTGYLMGDASNQAQNAQARRQGNMQMVGGLIQGGMEAGAALGSAGMSLAASKNKKAP